VPGRLLYATVNIFTVPHLHHEDKQNIILDLIDDAIVFPGPDMHAIELFFGFHVYESLWARILFQTENITVHLLTDVRFGLADLPLSGGRDLNAIAQP
jgi:hypothetical protein